MSVGHDQDNICRMQYYLCLDHVNGEMLTTFRVLSVVLVREHIPNSWRKILVDPSYHATRRFSNFFVHPRRLQLREGEVPAFWGVS